VFTNDFTHGHAHNVGPKWVSFGDANDFKPDGFAIAKR
jgi:hypothetical protein